MQKFLFRNVYVVDPQSPHHLTSQDIIVENGQISEIGDIKSPVDEGVQVFSLEEGTHVSPGWLDMEVHLQDPGYEWKESMEQLVQSALQGGFTSLHCLTDIHPSPDNSQVINALQRKAEALPVELLFSGNITLHREGKELAEMYDMHLAGAVSFSDGTHTHLDSGILHRALLYSQAFEGLLIRYPYDKDLLGDGQANEGAEAVSIGLKGSPILSEVLGIIRDIELASYSQSPLHFQPLTSFEGLSAINRAKESGLTLSSAIGIPYLCLDDSTLSSFDSVYKVFPPLRSKEQVQKLKEALQSGWVDALCTCHSAQGIEEKNKEFGLASHGMLGLQTAFPLIQEYLIGPGLLNYSHMVELLSINPRRILGRDAVSIVEGSLASLTFFHPQKKWKLDPSQIPSKAKNSAFLGKPLTGKVVGVFTKNQFYPPTN